jgi:hypothetical protein
MSLNSLINRYESQCLERNLPYLCAQDLEFELIASRLGKKTKIPKTMTDEEIVDNLGWVRRFQVIWRRCLDEERVIGRLCIEALKHGYHFHFVNDGEENHPVEGHSIEEIIDYATAVDESAILFKGKTSGKILSFYLIFGNSAEELIADHTDHPDAELIWQAVQKRISA